MSGESEKLERIRGYWDDQARRHASDLAATTPDPLLKELELDALGRALQPDLDTLEMGCGNGYNLLHLADKLQGRLVGVDYAAAMIEAAQRSARASPHRDRLSFHVGDILGDLTQFGEFPQIYTDRCIINLPTLELQVGAVENLADILAPGGRLILIECTQQAQERLNGLRATVGLSPIPYHWHNLYLDEDAFLSRTSSHLRLVRTESFSSLYYVISRVFNAKLTPPGESPDYLSELNRIARRLPSFGDFGPHKLFLFEKAA